MMILECSLPSKFLKNRSGVGLGTTIIVNGKKVIDNRLEASCSDHEKPLEKSGLEPAAPSGLTDRKYCASSTQPNPHLLWCRRFEPGLLQVLHSMAFLVLCLEAFFPQKRRECQRPPLFFRIASAKIWIN